jgi:predicted nucleic acid-binding protein
MKELIFVDTSFLIALFSKKDVNHKESLSMRNKIQKAHQSIILYYSDYIFDELITFLKKRKEHYAITHAEIINIGDKIKQSKILNCIHITEKLYEKTWDYIKKYQDKDWSFTDMVPSF